MATVNLRAMKVVGNWYSGSGMNQYVTSAFKNKASTGFKSGGLVALDATPELLHPASIVNAGTDDRLDVSAISTIYKGTSPSIMENTTLALTIVKLYGLAMKDSAQSGASQDYIPVVQFIPGTLLEGNLVTAIKYTGITATSHQLVAADLMAPVGLLYDSSTKQWYFTLDVTTAAERCCDIVKIGLGIAGTTDSGGLGDYNVRVQAVIRPTAIRLGSVGMTGDGTT